MAKQTREESLAKARECDKHGFEKYPSKTLAIEQLLKKEKV